LTFIAVLADPSIPTNTGTTFFPNISTISDWHF
jgi:hypothetical protein